MKSIKEILRKPPAHWVGDGFHVFPVFENKAFTSELSPFLMFDYGAPKQFPPSRGKKLGVGQHPHRGMETVTIAFQGEIEHGDNQGNKGVIGPGDCQWMSASRGIVHEEYHSPRFSEQGGTLEMCQLWVNLRACDKMSKPRYQPILAKDIPVVPLYSPESAAATATTTAAEATVFADGAASATASQTTDSASEDLTSPGTVRVISGNYRGTQGAASTHTHIDVWDVEINAKQKTFELTTPAGHNTLIFVRRGSVSIGGSTLGLADVAILKREGTTTHVQALEKSTKLLVLSGEPIDEPIAARGPFVMNTQQELQQAMSDFQNRRNGF